MSIYNIHNNAIIHSTLNQNWKVEKVFDLWWWCVNIYRCDKIVSFSFVLVFSALFLHTRLLFDTLLMVWYGLCLYNHIFHSNRYMLAFQSFLIFNWFELFMMPFKSEMCIHGIVIVTRYSAAMDLKILNAK